ncbi:MAG: hypothetical protein LBV54_05035, partial [Puniceicoccales bacterium]|nr:hypothetical protein [Puniceicoccales bacterium]
MNYEFTFQMFATEIALVIGALLVLAVDLALLRGKPHGVRVGVATAIGLFAVLAAGWESFGVNQFVLSRGYEPIVASFLSGHFLGSGRFILNAKLVALALGALTLLLIAGTSRLKNPAEHVALTLFALAGITLMCAAQNLLVIFLALELASLSLYILAGFDKTRPESAEAGLKYFLYGGTAAAFLLFGFSLLYGLTGEIHLPLIATKLATLPTSPLLVVALVMVLVGFGYKAAAAPFHLWAPDAYQGAPVTSAALIASASKVGGLVLLARFLIAASEGKEEWRGEYFISKWTPHSGWFVVLAVLIVASLLLG